MSAENSGIESIQLTPEAKKAKIIDTFMRLVIRGSEIRPLVMAIEDMHWIDKSSEDCLSNLLANISGASVFLLFTYLSILKDSELIYERGIFPQSTYIFKHALTQEVVNDSILTKRKKKLHEAIGSII